jgi:hypothetical protein
MGPMLELTITSPCVHSRVDSNTFTMHGHGQPYARVDFIPHQGLWFWLLFVYISFSLVNLPTVDFLKFCRSNMQNII